MEWISKVLFHMIYLFLSFERVFPLRMWKDSLIPVSVVNYAHMRYPKTLSQKVITYHWDQATIGNGSLFSHKNTQHTALATVTLDCIVLQSIFGLRHLCAKTDIKYRKSVFRNCPKEYPLIFMIDFKIIGHRLSWTTVDGWFTYLFFVILSDACFTLHMNKLNHPINPHRPKCPKIRSANNILMVFVFFREGRTQSAFDHEK